MGRKAQSRTGLEIEKMLSLIFQWYFFMVKGKKKAKIKGNKLIYTYIHRLYIQIHIQILIYASVYFSF